MPAPKREVSKTRLERLEALLVELYAEVRSLRGEEGTLDRDAIRQLLGKPIPEIERELVLCALRVSDGNRTKAAQLLRMSLRTLHYKLKQYGLPSACKR